MSTKTAFRVALLIEFLAYLGTSDARLTVIYGLVVYAACRGLWAARHTKLRVKI